jgi:beta-lactamase regulating signal transducer with metallopeptidase domain
MTNLFVFAAHNTVAALVFAVLVAGLMRVWRNPPVAHVLWLLVLLKLVAPPVMRIDWPALLLPGSMHAGGQIIAEVSRIEVYRAESIPRLVDEPTASSTAQAPVPSATEHDFAASLRLFWNRGGPVLLGFWLGGAAPCALLAARRIMRFERLVRDTLPAPERLQRLAFELAGKLGVRRVPDVRYVACVEVPLLWCAGRRATIVLPMRLLGQLDEQSAALILAHELAHLRRRDHWVRAVELIVSTVYWWNPLVWLIRRQMHQAEELCCDAWVRWAFPDCTKRYAELVLKTAESLNASRVGARLLPASPFLGSISLKARIEMILESRFAPCVSTRTMFVMALFALVVLPWFVQTTKTEARAGSNDETPAPKPGTSTTSEFPYKLKFEQGATRFLDGDKISILEVRGTADTFAPGNIYWIKGTYTLGSRDRAILLASITVTDPVEIMTRGDLAVRSDHHPGKATATVPGQATGVEFKVQRTVVNRGAGTFTLFLPMSYKGSPHVSFYRFEDGEGFGGNYFGTGDSVLKRWWGSKETGQSR